MTISNTFNGKFIDNENESLRTIEIAKTVRHYLKSIDSLPRAVQKISNC